MSAATPMVAAMAPTVASQRRLSLPETSDFLFPAKQQAETDPTDENNSEKDFEMDRFVDTPEDMAIVETFQPKRHYFSIQCQTSIPAKFVQKLLNRVAARRRRVSELQSKPSLTAFEHMRKKNQKEEGTLYNATRAVEKATRSWKQKTKELGPSQDEVVPTEAEKKKEQQKALMELLDRDANKFKDNVSSFDEADAEDEQQAKEAAARAERKKKKRETLLALLEKDANKHRDSVMSFNYYKEKERNKEEEKKAQEAAAREERKRKKRAALLALLERDSCRFDDSISSIDLDDLSLHSSVFNDSTSVTEIDDSSFCSFEQNQFVSQPTRRKFEKQNSLRGLLQKDASKHNDSVSCCTSDDELSLSTHDQNREGLGEQAELQRPSLMASLGRNTNQLNSSISSIGVEETF